MITSENLLVTVVHIYSHWLPHIGCRFTCAEDAPGWKQPRAQLVKFGGKIYDGWCKVVRVPFHLSEPHTSTVTHSWDQSGLDPCSPPSLNTASLLCIRCIVAFLSPAVSHRCILPSKIDSPFPCMLLCVCPQVEVFAMCLMCKFGEAFRSKRDH